MQTQSLSMKKNEQSSHATRWDSSNGKFLFVSSLPNTDTTISYCVLENTSGNNIWEQIDAIYSWAGI